MSRQQTSQDEQLKVVVKLQELKQAAKAIQVLSAMPSLDQLEQETRATVALYNSLHSILSITQDVCLHALRGNPRLFQQMRVALPADALIPQEKPDSIVASERFLQSIDVIKSKGFQSAFQSFFDTMKPFGLFVDTIAGFIHGLYQRRKDLTIDQFEQVEMVVLQNFDMRNVKNPTLAQLRDYIAMFELSQDVIANRLSFLTFTGSAPLTAEDIQWCIAYRQDKFQPRLEAIINHLISLHVFFVPQAAWSSSDVAQQQMTMGNIDSWAPRVDQRRAVEFFNMMEQFGDAQKSAEAQQTANNATSREAQSKAAASNSQMRRRPGGLGGSP